MRKHDTSSIFKVLPLLIHVAMHGESIKIVSSLTSGHRPCLILRYNFEAEPVVCDLCDSTAVTHLEDSEKIAGMKVRGAEMAGERMALLSKIHLMYLHKMV